MVKLTIYLIISMFNIILFSACEQGGVVFTFDDLNSSINNDKEPQQTISISQLLKENNLTGIGKEGNGVFWKIDIAYKNGKYFVSYPSLNCSGEWKYLPGPSSENRAYFEEIISQGKENCISGLRIELIKINKNFLKFDVISGALKISRFNNGTADSGSFSGFNHNIQIVARGKLTTKNYSNNLLSSNNWEIEYDMNNAFGNTYINENGIGMIVDFYVNNKGNQKKSMLKLYKLEKIQQGLLGHYNIFMDINDVYGESVGHVIGAGYDSSGVAGTYACFLDKKLNELGCLAWTDHTNKFVLFRSFDYGFNESFYTTELNPVFRRGTPHKKFILDLNLLDEIKNHSLKLYKLKDKISYIKYGAFVSEASISDECYKCSASINFSDITLYKN